MDVRCEHPPRRRAPRSAPVAALLLALACAPRGEESAPPPAEPPPPASAAAAPTGRPIPTVEPLLYVDGQPVTHTLANRVAIDRAASLLKKDPELHLLLIGRTDSRGAPAAVNLERGLARAREIKADIIRRVDVDAARIKAGSRGQASPVASNDDDAGRAQNRRVEFFFYYPDGEPLAARFDYTLVIAGE